MEQYIRVFLFGFFVMFVFIMLIISFFLSANTAKAYGPFSLPIHNNSVQINGGVWHYSSNCIVTGDHGGFDFDGEEGDYVESFRFFLTSS